MLNYTLTALLIFVTIFGALVLLIYMLAKAGKTSANNDDYFHDAWMALFDLEDFLKKSGKMLPEECAKFAKIHEILAEIETNK